MIGVAMGDLVIENLSMRFDLPNGGSVQALKDVSLKLAKGRAAEVLGPRAAARRRFSTSLPDFSLPPTGR
jgi:taurine transport system ATP-binding protein